MPFSNEHRYDLQRPIKGEWAPWKKISIII